MQGVFHTFEFLIQRQLQNSLRNGQKRTQDWIERGGRKREEERKEGREVERERERENETRSIAFRRVINDVTYLALPFTTLRRTVYGPGIKARS